MVPDMYSICTKLKFTSLLQQLPGSILDDLGSSYVSAVEHFEKAARSVSSERGAHAVPAEIPVADSTVAATTGPFLH